MTDLPPSGWARHLRWTPLGLALVGSAILVAVFAGQEPVAAPESAVTTTPSTTTQPSTTTSTTPPIITTTTTLPEPAELRGGSVVVAYQGEMPTSLHPWRTENEEIAAAVNAMTSTRAVGLDPITLDPVPVALAELPSLENGGLEYHEDGGVTVTLRLRPEARWADGAAVSGNDLFFTATTLAEDARLPEAVRAPYALIDPESWLVGPNSVRFDLIQRSIDYLTLFDPILPSHQMADTDLFDDWTEQPWLSAGPFVLERITDTAAELSANPRYWEVGDDGEPLPYLAKMELRVPGEDDVAGAADVVPLSAGPIGENLDVPDGLAIMSAPGREWEHLAFQFGSGRLDVNPGSLNASPTFRTFTAALIDRVALVDEFFPDARIPLDTVVGASWPAARGAGWPETMEAPPDLLSLIADELGTTFDEPPTVNLVTTDSLERTQFAGVVLQSLASAGIGVEVSLEDPGLFFRDFVIAGEFDLAEFAWTATPGPIGAVRDLEERFVSGPTRGGFNFYRWGSEGSIETGDDTEAFRALVAELPAEMDLETLAQRLAEADDILAEHVVVVPLYLELTHSAVSDAVVGFVQPAGALPVTSSAKLWQKAPEAP